MRAFCEVLGGRCHVSLTVSLGFSDSEKKKKNDRWQDIRQGGLLKFTALSMKSHLEGCVCPRAP